MSGATLVRTTMVGVRPLGVRGEPLHQAQAQIRGVVRRRLGERHYHLLAEPEPHDLGGRIDWYSELAGPVRPLASLDEVDRAQARADIDALLADIDRLGQSLEAGPTEDGRLAGRSLRLATTRPSDDYLFLVGDQPVIVCWGYDTEAAGAVLPGAFTPVAATPAAAPVAPPIAATVAPPMTVAVPAGGAAALTHTRLPWLYWLLAGLLAILILLLASWLLRQVLPVPPDLRVTELPADPPPPPAPPDPTIGLKAELDGARDAEARLRATLASLRDELARRLALCKPPEPPPKPPEPPKPPPVAERKPPPKPPDLPEDRWKKGDLSLLKGCWRLGRDADTNLSLPGGRVVAGRDRAGRICFGDNGQGTREKTGEFPGQPAIRCRAPITAVFAGDGTLRTTQPRVDCQPSGFFWTDRPNYLTCRRASDTVALCRDNLGGEHEFRRE